MTESEREQLLTDARIVHLAAPVILPLIERRQLQAMQKLLGKYRDGRTDFITDIAELFVLKNLTEDIVSKQNVFETLTQEIQHGR